MESTWQAVQEHMDAKFFNGDGLGSSRNFSGGNEVDQVEDVLLNSCLRESKHLVTTLRSLGHRVVFYPERFTSQRFPMTGTQIGSNQVTNKLITIRFVYYTTLT